MDTDQEIVKYFTKIWDTNPQVAADYSFQLRDKLKWKSVEGIIVYNFYYFDQLPVIKTLYTGKSYQFNQQTKADLYGRAALARDAIQELLNTYMETSAVANMWTNGIIFVDRPIKESALEFKLRFDVNLIKLDNFDLTKYIKF